MFDGYIFTEGSLANVEVDGEAIGFEMRTRIPYYRGIPLSMVHDVEVEVDTPFSPEEPPGSWQDARVAATPMALMAARIRFEAVIMMEPPLLSIRPRRPEEYRDSMQHPSFKKWGDSHGEKLCRTRCSMGTPGDSHAAHAAMGSTRGVMGSTRGAPLAREIT